MNAPDKVSAPITVFIGQAEVRVPGHLAAMAYIEQQLGESRRPESSWLAPIARLRPSIGAEIHGGKYAGLSVHENQPCDLILLPGELESTTWKAAVDWASERGGVLPSRFDQLVLFQNLKSDFKEAWYWAAEQPAGSEGYAWCQSFGNGSQDWGHVSDHDRAVAVRRLPIQ